MGQVTRSPTPRLQNWPEHFHPPDGADVAPPLVTGCTADVERQREFPTLFCFQTRVESLTFKLEAKI